MMFRIWYSTESLADFIIDNTILRNSHVEKKRLYESDASNPRNFHTLPDRIKKILYLDSPDIIVEKDFDPIFSMEISQEAGTGHNSFQRFARIAASVENNVPTFYVYPEAAIINRQNAPTRWDVINPLIFKALEDVMQIYNIPALYYYFPTDYRQFPDPTMSPNQNTKGIKLNTNVRYAGCPEIDNEIRSMFSSMNEIIETINRRGIIDGTREINSNLVIRERRAYMQSEFARKATRPINDMSPISSTTIIPTEYLINYLSRYSTAGYQTGELLRSRQETLIYHVNASFRGDPYPGCLSHLITCFAGREELSKNGDGIW